MLCSYFYRFTLFFIHRSDVIFANILFQNDSDEGKVIVFMGTQAMVDYHTELFATVLPNINFYKLHGKMTQVERTDVFKSFRSFENGVLMCSVCIM